MILNDCLSSLYMAFFNKLILLAISCFLCSIPAGSWEFFSSPPRSERLCGPPRFLSNGYHGVFPWGQSGRSVKMTSHLNVLPRSKNACSYTSTPQYVSMAWCLVKHRENFTFHAFCSVSIALGYGLDDRGSRLQFPAGAGNFSLHHSVQIGSGVHPVSYPMGIGGLFPWG
jgi:hypothetical protein